MLKIKKYANGRFFNTETKKYIKPEKLAELVKKGEALQVTLTKTGKDITESVIAQFTKKEEGKKETKEKKAGTEKKAEIPFLKTDKLVKWLGEVIDAKIEQVMDIVKLPSREQVAKLDENIKELNKKIDALALYQENAAKANASEKKAAAAVNKTAQKEDPAAETVTDQPQA